MTRRLTSTYAESLDTVCMLDAHRSPRFKTPQCDLLTPNSIDKSHAFRFVLLILILLQMAIPMSAYSYSYSVDQLRLYTHSRVINYKEFICIDKVLWQESRYNYLARNGSHYGIGQMKSKHYQSKDPYTQIDLTIAYIHKRYTTMCKALAFHKRHGYY